MQAMNLEEQMRTDLINMDNVRSFKGRHMIKITDYNRDEIMVLLETGRIIAKEVRENQNDLSQVSFNGIGSGKRGLTAFFEPSTRTHDSSLVAMTHLGIPNPIQRRSAEGTSQKKRESLAHDLMMYSAYNSHVVVMRHPLEGSPQWAADYIEKMAKMHNKVVSLIVNGGDGARGHPTQGLLDALGYYLLYFVDNDGNNLRRTVDYDSVMSGLTLYGIGDSLKGRTIKDNARLLSKFKNNRLVLVGPSEIRMPQYDIDDLKKSGLEVDIFEDIPSALDDMKSAQMPIGYFLRLQEERLDSKIVRRVRNQVYLVPKVMKDKGLLVKYDETRKARVMLPMFHPFPMAKDSRELHPDFEDTPHFKCFDEAEMGPYMRTGIIGLGLGLFEVGVEKPYIDTRIKKDHPKYTELEIGKETNGGNKKPEFNNMFDALVQILLTEDEGVAALTHYCEKIKTGKDPQEELINMLNGFSNSEELIEKYRHLTFRFVEGEDGCVLDHIPNGLTGLVKYNLGLSDLINTDGCDGKPIIVSAVDGLKSKEHGLKGVIKVRGYLLPPDEIHELHTLCPDLTLAHLNNGKLTGKWGATEPHELVDFINCNNSDCVSLPEYSEHVPTIFYKDNGGYRCRYCDKLVKMNEIRGLLIKGG